MTFGPATQIGRPMCCGSNFSLVSVRSVQPRLGIRMLFARRPVEKGVLRRKVVLQSRDLVDERKDVISCTSALVAYPDLVSHPKCSWRREEELIRRG